jgi:hypothetical protein
MATLCFTLLSPCVPMCSLTLILNSKGYRDRGGWRVLGAHWRKRLNPHGDIGTWGQTHECNYVRRHQTTDRH